MNPETGSTLDRKEQRSGIGLGDGVAVFELWCRVFELAAAVVAED